jgi:hypothetical protein
MKIKIMNIMMMRSKEKFQDDLDQEHHEYEE